MKTLIWGAGLLLLLSGCATVEMADYNVVSFADVALREGAKVQIKAMDPGLNPVVEALEKSFAENGKFQVVDADADYWIVLAGSEQYGTSAIGTKKSVEERNNGEAGRDVLMPHDINLSSAARSLSVSVYEAKNLTPVTYQDVCIYDGDCTEQTARQETDYKKMLEKDVIERLEDMFLTRAKAAKIPVPLEANRDLRKFFKEKKYVDFLKRYRELGTIDLNNYRTKAFAGTLTKEDKLDERMANYYLYLLVRESVRHDPEILRKTLGEHLSIIESTTAKGVVDSVPVALQRIEMQLKNIE